MTVSYTGDVANGSSFGCFWKILGRWRGSVYKLIWRELIAYLFLYYIINFIYRFGLDDTQKTTFEKIKVYCRKNIESIPMSFVLGFYVTLIVKRWWDQYWILPMPDSLALYISASIQGQDERGRLLRRTIMRYTMLAYIICLQRISFRVKKRFPTMTHLVESGLMTESEMKIYEKMDQKAKVLKFWMPVVWASNLVNRARHEGRIHSDHMVQTIVTELSDFRRKLGRIMVFDNVSVPLVYTQVVTLAVYTYFLAALIGRQWVRPREEELIAVIYPGYELDLYFPIFLSLQFIFYIGWLKVAETLINPFGEDDDDFELNWLIDRHIKVSYMVVDEMHEEHPELLKDQYWEQVVPQDLPYNIASERYRKNEPQGSTASLKVNPSESVYADLTSVKRHSTIPDDVYAEYESVAESPLADGRKNWLQRQLSRVESFRSTSSSSSLFGRNRANSAVNGGLGIGYHGHHRPSLYERLMNRRSSKEARRSSRGIHRPANNSLNVPEKGFLPNSRPRVPTPDVTKENNIHPQLQITAASPPPASKFIPTKVQYSGDVMSSPSANPVYGSPPSSQNTPLYAKRNQYNLTQVSSTHPIHQPLPAAPDTSSGNTSTYVSTSKLNNNSTPPPPYDQAHPSTPTNAMILSTIAENDTSPYSTSSTTHAANNASVYPTTKSIFGRKSSPPPLDELPRPPNLPASSAHSSTQSSLKSDHGSSLHRNTGQMMGTKHLFSVEATPMPNHQNAFEMHGRVNEGYETDEGDDGRRYMTIAEVNECRVELEKKLTVQPIQPPLVQNMTQRNPSDDLVPLPTGAIQPPTAEVTPTPIRHGQASISRQDAIDTSSESIISHTAPITTTVQQPGLHAIASGSTPQPLKETSLTAELLGGQPKNGSSKLEAEEDDGYHERVSYSEDDADSNHSDKNVNSGKSSPSKSFTVNIDPTNGVGSKDNVVVHYTLWDNSDTSNSLGIESDETKSNRNMGTIKSNASDSDISHVSISSLDQTLPMPTRQKPIRRRKSQHDTSLQEDNAPANEDNDESADNETTTSNGDVPKDKEVFV